MSGKIQILNAAHWNNKTNRSLLLQTNCKTMIVAAYGKEFEELKGLQKFKELLKYRNK